MSLSYISTALVVFVFLYCIYISRLNKKPLIPYLKEVERLQKSKDEARIGESKPRYHLKMGLRLSRGQPWINLDENWLMEHNARRKILDNPKNVVIRCLPGSELACEEVMMQVVKDLVTREPMKFRRYNDRAVDRVEIVETGETFIIASPFGRLRPLEIAARLAMEDFNILKMGSDGQHRL